MRAVKGTVVSSRPISLSKAAGILRRFTAGETGLRPEVAAYVRLASAAFDELVHFHREIRGLRKRPELETHMEPKDDTNGDDTKKRKRQKRETRENSSGFGSEDGAEENPSLTEWRNPRDGMLGEGGVLGEENLPKGKRNHGHEVELLGGGGLVGSEERRHDKRKKKKKREVVEEEKSNLDSNDGKEEHEKRNLEREENEVEVVEERHWERKKKKGKKEGNKEEEVFRRDLDGEGRDRVEKKRKHLDTQEELGDSNDQSERHKRKKKKRRKIDSED